MKLLAISDHTKLCKNSGYRIENYFVFQIGYRFYMVTYCGCLDCGNHLDFKMRILGHFSKKKRAARFKNRHCDYYISKSNILKEATRTRKIDILLGRKCNEICYDYSDNAGKDYCMIREHSYMDYLKEANEYENRYAIAKEIVMNSELIKSNMKEVIVESINDLHYYNSEGLNKLTDFQMVTLTDILSKHFVKTLINDNDSN